MSSWVASNEPRQVSLDARTAAAPLEERLSELLAEIGVCRLARPAAAA